MDPRLTMVRLAVDDVERSCAFYEALGWQRHKLSFANIAAFQLGPLIFTVVRKDILKNELGLPEDPHGGAGRITLDHHVSQKDEVEALVDAAEANGATVLCHGADGLLGAAHYGCFEDPDGHVWRIVCSNFVTVNLVPRTSSITARALTSRIRLRNFAEVTPSKLPNFDSIV